MMNLIAVLVTLLLPQRSIGFSPHPQNVVPASHITLLQARTAPEVGSTSSEPTASGGAPTSTTAATSIFPVLRRISGFDWEGDCRYVDANLRPVADLKLTGGLRYDVDSVNAACTMSSFLTFPNGQARRVVMAGFKLANSPTMRLESVEEGPIYMTVSEMYPDTVLVNEIEGVTGKVVMTTSVSIVNGGEELVMVSHEIGEGRSTIIDGHQIWRLRKAKKLVDEESEEGEGNGSGANDDSFRGTTGR